MVDGEEKTGWLSQKLSYRFVKSDNYSFIDDGAENKTVFTFVHPQST